MGVGREPMNMHPIKPRTAVRQETLLAMGRGEGFLYLAAVTDVFSRLCGGLGVWREHDG